MIPTLGQLLDCRLLEGCFFATVFAEVALVRQGNHHERRGRGQSFAGGGFCSHAGRSLRSGARIDAVAEPRYPLVIVLAAVCVGIFADRAGVAVCAPIDAVVVVCCGWPRWSVGMCYGAIIICALRWRRWPWRWRRPAARGITHGGICLTTTTWAASRWARIRPICLEASPCRRRAGSHRRIHAAAAVRPEEQWRFVVEPIAVRDGDTWRTASGRAQVTVTGKLEGIHAGDRLQIFGHLYPPEPAGNPGEFDYALQDRGNRELSMVHVKQPECVTLIEAGSAWSPWRWIDYLRNEATHCFRDIFSAARGAGFGGAVGRARACRSRNQ